jgi:2-polyprenyl-6-methoxyphenol hydroxylase-like FAD-dependent oxidoreductase
VSLFWSVPVSDFSRSDFDLESWKAKVLSLEPRAAELLKQIARPGQLLPATYFDVSLPRFDADRLVFIGDAAHATSPQLGQGTNLALEDARVLSACISASEDLAQALSAYTRARQAHTRYYQRASWGLTPFFQSDFGSLAALRDAAMGRLCLLPPSKRLMLATLCGVQRGFLGATLPLRPIRARLGRNSA